MDLEGILFTLVFTHSPHFQVKHSDWGELQRKRPGERVFSHMFAHISCWLWIVYINFKAKLSGCTAIQFNRLLQKKKFAHERIAAIKCARHLCWQFVHVSRVLLLYVLLRNLHYIACSRVYEDERNESDAVECTKLNAMFYGISINWNSWRKCSAFSLSNESAKWREWPIIMLLDVFNLLMAFDRTSMIRSIS